MPLFRVDPPWGPLTTDIHWMVHILCAEFAMRYLLPKLPGEPGRLPGSISAGSHCSTVWPTFFFSINIANVGKG